METESKVVLELRERLAETISDYNVLRDENDFLKSLVKAFRALVIEPTVTKIIEE